MVWCDSDQNRHGISNTRHVLEQENGLADEGFIGKNILEAYPQLTQRSPSHFRAWGAGACSMKSWN